MGNTQASSFALRVPVWLLLQPGSQAMGTGVLPTKPTTNAWTLTCPCDGPGGPISPQAQPHPHLSLALHIPVDFTCSTTNQLCLMLPFSILTCGVHPHPQGLNHLPRCMVTPSRSVPRGSGERGCCHGRVFPTQGPGPRRERLQLLHSQTLHLSPRLQPNGRPALTPNTLSRQSST